MIPSKDRNLVSVGDEVEILVNRLNQHEYGTLQGKLESIDIDSSISYDGKVYFKGNILLDNDYLFDSKNKKIKIPTGVTGGARIQYKNVSYFEYFLDILGIEI